MKQIAFSLIFLSWSIVLLGQTTTNAISKWKGYFSFHGNKQMVLGKDRIYCANKNAIFYVQRSDLYLYQMSKCNGLSDVGISRIGCDPTQTVLIIGYDNGNIDVIKNDQTTNFVDLKTRLINANKAINDIVFLANKAFLATNFGIIVLDYTKNQIEDTYVFSNAGVYVGVNKLFADSASGLLYAATQKGIYTAKYGETNIADFSNWNSISAFGSDSYNQIATLNNMVFANKTVNKTDSLYVLKNGIKEAFKKQFKEIHAIRVQNNMLQIISKSEIYTYDNTLVTKNIIDSAIYRYANFYDAAIDNDNSIWMIENADGLFNSFYYKALCPTSPYSDEVSSINRINNSLICTHGVPWLFRPYKTSYFDADKDSWSWSIMYNAFDPTCSAINKDDKTHFYVGTFGAGIVEYEKDYTTVKNRFNSSNCLLSSDTIAALNVDTAGNLFVMSARCKNPFSVYTKSKKWMNWDYPEFPTVIDSKTMYVDKNNWKWVNADNGMFVFNDKKTPLNPDDDDRKFLLNVDNSGELIGEQVLSFAFDLNNVLWIGTSSGLAYYPNPDQIFGDSKPYMSRNKITVNGVVDYLLATENVNCIEVDAANRKWVGTNNGVFLVSSNGTEVIEHYTVDNCPLPSNAITSLKLYPENSELYIGTLKGMVSYNIGIKEAKEDYNEVSIYPNPVKHDFNGYVKIEGLIANSTVKIIDINGDLVYEAISEGGTAFWNGNNLIGRRVASGVYVVVIVNSDQTQKKVSKIIFIN